MSNKVKDATEEADDLAHDAACRLEELCDLLADIDDEEDEDAPTTEAQAALRAVETLQNAERWRSSLTSDGDDDQDESEFEPAPTSP
jgi:hypothetical protein